MPNYTLVNRGDSGAGSKADVKRVTAMLSVNGDGSDTSVVIIGVSKKPRGTSSDFFASLNVRYFHNKTAWMNSNIFRTLLKEFDQKMTSKTILLLENFSGHTIEELEDYDNIVPIFLPANTMSMTQPLDAGIIANCKVKYRNKLMSYVLEQVKNGTMNLNNVTLARCIPWFYEAAQEIKHSTIRKCFYKTLKLDIFNQEDNDNELKEDLQMLQDSMQIFLGDKKKLTCSM
jgi:hypothetical protein